MLLQDPAQQVAAAQAAYMAAIIFWIIFWISWIAVTIVCAIWVYKDAKERSDVDETMWLIIVILGGIVGFIVYYFVVIKAEEK